MKHSLEQEAYLCILWYEKRNVRNANPDKTYAETRKKNVPFQVRTNADPWSLHGVKLGDLLGFYPGSDMIGTNKALQNNGQNSRKSQSFNGFFARHLHLIFPKRR